MAGVDISDRDAARIWLKSQSFGVGCAIASRAALRVCANIGWPEGDSQNMLALATFRAALTSAVCGLGKTEDQWLISAAALSAFFARDVATSPPYGDAVRGVASAGGVAALSAANSALSVAYSNNSAAVTYYALSAANPARSGGDPTYGDTTSGDFIRFAAADSARSAADDSAGSAYKFAPDDAKSAYDAASFDAKNLDIVKFETPLWPTDRVPRSIEKNHLQFLAGLAADRKIWSFWHDWYLGMWEGTFRDWDFATEVAKIPDDVWKEGSEAVAEEIQRLSDEHIVRMLPQVEEVFENEQGLYDTRSTVADPSKLIDSVLKRLEFTLDTALNSNMCDLSAMSLPAKLLRHVLAGCGDDPNSMEQYLRQASALIKKKIESGQFAEDDELSLLVGVLDETALQLRADHPDVAAASEARVGQTLREIDEAKRIEIANSIENMQEGSAPRLAAEFGLAAETTRSNGPHEAQASAIKMSSERAAKISIAERAKKVEGSGTMSALKIGLRGNRLVQLAMELMSGGF